nr:hypothetical protein [Tanacetum cinerariifolium]
WQNSSSSGNYFALPVGTSSGSGNFLLEVGTSSGSGNTSLEAQQSSHTAPLSPSLPPATTNTIATSTPTEIPTHRQYSKRAKIAQSTTLPTAADKPASPSGDVSQGEAFPTVSGLEAGHDKENIIKTFALPHDSTPRVTSLAADEGRSLETKEEAGVEKSTKRGSNDTEELLNVFTSLDAANILTSRVQVVSVPPVVEVSTVGIPTSSGMVPTIPTSSDGLDRNNETIAKYLQEYEQFAADLPIGEKIDMINKLVKYQDHYAQYLSISLNKASLSSRSN